MSIISKEYLINEIVQDPKLISLIAVQASINLKRQRQFSESKESMRRNSIRDAISFLFDNNMVNSLLEKRRHKVEKKLLVEHRAASESTHTTSPSSPTSSLDDSCCSSHAMEEMSNPQSPREVGEREGTESLLVEETPPLPMMLEEDTATTASQEARDVSDRHLLSPTLSTPTVIVIEDNEGEKLEVVGPLLSASSLVPKLSSQGHITTMDNIELYSAEASSLVDVEQEHGSLSVGLGSAETLHTAVNTHAGVDGALLDSCKVVDERTLASIVDASGSVDKSHVVVASESTHAAAGALSLEDPGLGWDCEDGDATGSLLLIPPKVTAAPLSPVGSLLGYDMNEFEELEECDEPGEVRPGQRVCFAPGFVTAVHVVRPLFEESEVSELFYSAAERDQFQEEADAEERGTANPFDDFDCLAWRPALSAESLSGHFCCGSDEDCYSPIDDESIEFELDDASDGSESEGGF